MVKICVEESKSLVEIAREHELFGPQPSKFIESADTWGCYLDEVYAACDGFGQLVYMLPDAERMAISDDLQKIVARCPNDYDLCALVDVLMLLDNRDDDGPLPTVAEYDDPVTATIVGSPMDGMTIYAERCWISALKIWRLPQCTQIDVRHFEIRFSHSGFN